jgi:hypothetical protein
MKEEILKALKTKYAHLGLSPKILELKANQLAKSVTKTEEIETAVDGVAEDLQIFQSISDLVRGQKKPETKPDQEKKPEEKKEDQPSDEPDEKIPAWAKKMAEDNAQLTNLVQSLAAEKTLNSRRTQLEAELKNIKDLPDYYKEELLEACENRQFADDDSFNEFLTAKVTKANEVAQAQVNQSINAIGLPISGGGKPAAAKNVDDAILKWASVGKEAPKTN